jgi:hypothetical protein
MQKLHCPTGPEVPMFRKMPERVSLAESFRSGVKLAWVRLKETFAREASPDKGG